MERVRTGDLFFMEYVFYESLGASLVRGARVRRNEA